MASTNPYDGKAFEITTPDPGADGHYGNGYISTADGSMPPAIIRGDEIGTRYALDPKKTGNSDDYIDGPWVGPEVNEFLAKRGGVDGRLNGGDVAPWPGWTEAQFEAPLSSPVTGGPNAGPWNPTPVPAPTPTPVVTSAHVCPHCFTINVREHPTDHWCGAPWQGPAPRFKLYDATAAMIAETKAAKHTK